MIPFDIKWRLHRIQDAVATGITGGNAADSLAVFSLYTLVITWVCAVVGGLLGPFVAAVAACIGFGGSLAIGGFVLYCVAKGRVAGGLPYGWIRTNDERWVEAERNDKAGYSVAEREVRIENPLRGDEAWCTLLNPLGQNQRKKLRLNSADQPVTTIGGEYWDFETQKIMKQLSAGS